MGSLTFGQRRPDRLPRPAARRRDPGRDGARRAARAIPVDAGRGPLVPRAVPVPRRRRVQGGAVAVGRRAVAAGARAARDQPSNLLLLDEPTNHLDIPAREAIESFMRESPATLLVVSHDRRLLETMCDRLWVVDDGLAVAVRRRLSRVAGRRRRRLDVRGGGRTSRHDGARVGHADRPRSRRPSRRRATAPAAMAPPPVTAVGTAPRRGAELSKDAYRRQKAALDAELTRLGLRKSHLELAMGDPAVAANFVELRRVTSELADVDAALAAGRGSVAGARGAGAVTRPARPDRHHRPDRLWQVDGRRLARRAGASVIDADAVARDVTAPGQPGSKPSSRGSASGPAPDGTLDRAALGRIVSPTRRRCATSRRSSIRAVRPGSWPRSSAPRGTGAPAVVVEAIKLVEGGLAELCDEVWLVDLRRRRPAGPAHRPGDAGRRRGSPDRGPGRAGRAAARARDPRGRHGWERRTHARVDDRSTRRADGVGAVSEVGRPRGTRGRPDRRRRSGRPRRRAGSAARDGIAALSARAPGS